MLEQFREIRGGADQRPHTSLARKGKFRSFEKKKADLRKMAGEKMGRKKRSPDASQGKKRGGRVYPTEKRGQRAEDITIRGGRNKRGGRIRGFSGGSKDRETN